MEKRKTVLILLATIPVPTIAVWLSLYLWPGRPLGQALFLFCKVYILLFPLIWHMKVDKHTLSLSKPVKGGFGINVAIGLVVFVVIGAAWILLGGYFIDKESAKTVLGNAGFSSPEYYITAAVYWIVINSLQEEYFWRWFIVSKAAKVVKPGWAIIISAAGFVIHHFVAMLVYFDLLTTILCSLGVFLGGLIWSWSYWRFKSIWPGYVGHAIVDVIIFIIGYEIIFGV